MERIEYRTVDKSSWRRGEWDREPDKIQWQDEETGLPCLIVRGPSGALCGYVGVAEGHPWHGRGYSQCVVGDRCDRGDNSWCNHTPESLIRVHGGLTFAGSCQETPEDRGICHKPAAGEPDHVWWFGFDCAHSGDICPKWGRYTEHGDIYRRTEYVADECRELAKQLKALND